MSKTKLMKRFIDLRGADIFGIDSQAIAYYDTVRDIFETHSGAMAWRSFEEFASDYEGDDLKRYRNITPDWAMATQTIDVKTEAIDEPMFATRIYKTEKGWSFENILTDVLPNDVNTFCTDFPKHLAWKEMIYYLNYSSRMIQRIKDKSNSRVVDNPALLPHK